MAGKRIGIKVYIHKDYTKGTIPTHILNRAQKLIGEFKYNCVMWNQETNDVRFDSALDFDEAREPHVGSYICIKADGSVKHGTSNSIWHHKWMWVGNDYLRFDIKESKEWAKLWKSKFKENAKGTDKSFNAQLIKYGLKDYV